MPAAPALASAPFPVLVPETSSEPVITVRQPALREAEAAREPVIAEVTHEPVVVEAAPEPVIAEASPEPVVAEVAPEPVIAEAAPEPVIAEAAPEPVIAEAAPEPMIAEAEPAIAEAALQPSPPEFEAAPEPVTLGRQPALLDEGPDDDGAEFGEHEDAGERTQIGGMPLDPTLADRLEAQLAEADADLAGSFALPALHAPTQIPDEEDIEDIEEISDFDVVDEEDAADGVPEDARTTTAPPIDDFASRLDLSEQHDISGLDDGYGERRYGERRYGDYDPAPEPALDFDEPHSYARRRDSDLENALEQLDVDLDDLSQARESSRPVRLPGLPTHRPESGPVTVLGLGASVKNPAKPRRVPTEDDGVLIDFDDEE
jgi:hypothetical protein